MYVASPRRCSLLRRTLYRYRDRFEDYEVRLAKKLAKKAEAQNSAGTQPAMLKFLGRMHDSLQIALWLSLSF